MKTAFVLAAGKGTRMMPLTEKTPKSLLKIKGKPMIDYTLDLLKFHGFEEIGINVSYLGSQIKQLVGNRVTVVAEEENPTGTAGGMLAISKRLKPQSPFFVISSDMMINFDLSSIYDFHLRHGGIATLCCYFRSKQKLIVSKSGQVLFDRKTKKVLDLVERSNKVKSQWVNSSVYVFNPEIIEILRKFQKIEIDISRDLVSFLLKKNKGVFAYPVNRKKYYQMGVDTSERIHLVEQDIRSGKFVPIDFKQQ